VKPDGPSPDSQRREFGVPGKDIDGGAHVGRVMIIVLSIAFTIGILFLVMAVWLDWA